MPPRSWIPIGLLLLASASPPIAPTLAAPPLPASLRIDTPQEECDALVEEVDKAVRDWISGYRSAVKQAKENGTDPPAFSWNASPIGGYVEKFQESADKYAGADGAIPFLAWIASEGSRSDVKLAKQAVETLFTVHGASLALAPHAENLGDWIWIVGKERGTELLADLEKWSPVPAIVGWAVYHRLQPAFSKAETGTEAYETMKADLLAASERAGSDKLTALLTKKIRIQEVFGLGVVAPDIQGIDLDGTDFALSDYRGKVIFVDFWGDW